ncbi:hypothetical protein EHS13_10250 [Paenibacillus psychroresistens]|uniref:Uncharacterized protein n=1 Tax=Paenibacillus psychroresistens TaxID=1778678 RepID=A0A6B8RFG9_9BACL|nr:hypothetical protein [Paenibacillus psychroresistens]QGQ95241.1 hypothetical protein EHS13_10250 [Paenibacillus psychroresistens]
MLPGQILKTDADFDNAILNAVEVMVTQYGSQLGRGQILSHSLHSVKLTSSYFFKDGSEFTICTLVHS